MHSDLIRRTLLGLAGAALVLALPSGCDAPVVLSNAVPRVTWVAVVPVGATTARITVWLSDAEGDSVDLAVAWLGSTGAATAIVEKAGSYGTIGLPTRDGLYDPNGQAHQILWDTSDVTGTVRLVMTPDDRPDEAKKGTGDTVETPAFDLGTGLPEPAPVEVVP